MRSKNKSSAFTPLFYLICVFLQIIAIKLSGKDNTIDTVIKNVFYEVVVDKTGSEYYDQLLATYAKHISDIKTFNHQKINTYLKFINRNLKPYPIELEFSCNNTNNKGESNVCTGFLSLKKKEISGEFVFGTYLKKEAEIEAFQQEAAHAAALLAAQQEAAQQVATLQDNHQLAVDGMQAIINGTHANHQELQEQHSRLECTYNQLQADHKNGCEIM